MLSEKALFELRELLCFWHDSRGKSGPFNSQYLRLFGNCESIRLNLSSYS